MKKIKRPSDTLIKKVQKIRELVRGTSAVLVIDNFTGEMDDDLIALLSTGLRIITLNA